MKSILNITHLDEKDKLKVFLGKNSGIQRFDFYLYPDSKKLEKDMRGAFWTPEEISMNNDILLYPSLPCWVRAIFEANIGYQTLMDSGNNRGLENALIPLVTLPEIEAMLKTQSYFELIHSLSYAHNLIAVFPDPTKVYNSIQTNKFIKNRIDREIDCYERLQNIQLNSETVISYLYNRLKKIKKTDKTLFGKISSSIKTIIDFLKTTDKELTEENKKTILEALIRINALEGLKFYTSFLTTYKINDEFGGKIAGATRIIKLINFDEDLHVLVFQFLINLVKENKNEGFSHLFEKSKDGELSFFETMARNIYKEVTTDEEEWGDYLSSFAEATKEDEVLAVNLKDIEEVERLKSLGYIISEAKIIPGLTTGVLKNFIRYFSNIRMEAIGLEHLYPEATKDSTVLWFLSYKVIDNEKTPSQEKETLSYSIGQLVDDVESEPFEEDFFNLNNLN